MVDQILLYVIALTTAGLVGKIIFDWLKNRNKDPDYVTWDECETFRELILDRLDKIENRLERIENIIMKHFNK
ncbi:MAG: hypothetical protein QXJ20_02715 [Candidatus Aenigmatarchaeota archaeon]